MTATRDAIIATTDVFCREHLDREYAMLARHAVAALCRMRPSPLASGETRTWACAVLYALGQLNFLSDKSFAPSMRLADLCALLGVGASTGTAKAKVVREALAMDRMNLEWMLPSLAKRHPLRLMLSIGALLENPQDLHGAFQERDVASERDNGTRRMARARGGASGHGSKLSSEAAYATLHALRHLLDQDAALDDPRQVAALLGDLGSCLPVTVQASPALVASLHEILDTSDLSAAWRVTAVDYAGDDGGIMCEIEGDACADGHVVVVSILHLAFDASMPLAPQIEAYQTRRRAQLALRRATPWLSNA